MPIFQADLDDERAAPPPRLAARRSDDARHAPDSLGAGLCHGPGPDSPPSADESATSSRAELIQRLKRGESPAWIPNPHLESLLQHASPDAAARPPERCSSGLLPAAPITPERSSPTPDDRLRDGLAMERPRSALHSGDFTHGPRPPAVPDDAPPAWAPRDFGPFGCERLAPPPSSSLSSSFAYKPPTSPLVQSESNDELDLALPPGTMDLAGRHSPGRDLLASSQPSPAASPRSRPSAAFGPFQAHQPRRSQTAAPAALPQTPAGPRSRRPSLGSDASPLQHASMVGSYEESILRGRMSTTPSKPFDFLAQIGVLARGKCKPSLRCPPHVTLPFAAVYYSYGSTPHGRSQADDDGPSPYVGQVDLENGLPNPDEELRARRKAQSRFADGRKPADSDLDMGTGSDADVGADERRRRTPRARRRSGSPRAPPGGSYRIPEKGQVQIVIKNQNKTAVKLFLVPYDLAGMEPGTKTFIRQRSYSAGPIIDHVPDAHGRPVLRYLVHLHICCPARGRFYLYKSIRVVFANRVPEGKERLRNETTWPDPRFSPYKPIRVMLPPAAGPAAMLAADKAFRRRSLGVAGAARPPDGAAAEHPIPLRPPPPPPPLDAAAATATQYEKLSKGDVGYGGPAGAEGLLSQRLRSLGVKPGEQDG